MELKEMISDFLLSNDPVRFKIEGIDYFFCQSGNYCIVENLARDVLLKFLEFLKAQKLKILDVISCGKPADSIPNPNILNSYSVTFQIV